MKLPNILNPLRGTSFSWLFPMTWSVIQWAWTNAPITVEVFLHHRFGARTAASLIKGFGLLFVVSILGSAVPSLLPLLSIFFVLYLLAATAQWLRAFHGYPGRRIHSYSTGEPWPFWLRLNLSTRAIQCYFEPLFCCYIAAVTALIDPALAVWLVFAGVALFGKEQMRHARLRTRRLNAADNQIDADELTPRIRPENEPFVEARPARPGPFRNRPVQAARQEVVWHPAGIRRRRARR